MKKLRYEIAGYLCEIICEDTFDEDVVLPSFCPFATGKSGELLFRCRVDDTFRFPEKGKEIGRFDCGGNNFGVYQLPDGAYQFEICNEQDRPCALMSATGNFASATVALIGSTVRERSFGLNNALMLAFAFSALDKKTLLMHSSVVCNDGKAYCFLGKSGTGKSTHSSLWLHHIPGSELMNDDNPVVRITDGKVYVYGSPWSGKTPCYRQVSAPVAAFVQLRQHGENHIRRMNVLEGMASLLISISTMKWDRRIYNTHCDTLSALLSSVPFYLLECLPDKDAAELSYKTLSGEWGR